MPFPVCCEYKIQNDNIYIREIVFPPLIANELLAENNNSLHQELTLDFPLFSRRFSKKNADFSSDFFFLRPTN